MAQGETALPSPASATQEYPLGQPCVKQYMIPRRPSGTTNRTLSQPHVEWCMAEGALTVEVEDFDSWGPPVTEARCYTFRGLKPEIPGPRGHSTPVDGGKVLHFSAPKAPKAPPVCHRKPYLSVVAIPYVPDDSGLCIRLGLAEGRSDPA